MSGIKIWDLDKDQGKAAAESRSPELVQQIMNRCKQDVGRGVMSEKNYEIISHKFKCCGEDCSCSKEEKTVEHGLTPCIHCGSSDFIRTGTCYTCTQCASTTGCS